MNIAFRLLMRVNLIIYITLDRILSDRGSQTEALIGIFSMTSFYLKIEILVHFEIEN